MISEFDHPDHGWKWTQLEVEFINKKLKEAYDRGYKHGAAGSTTSDPAEIRRVFEIDDAEMPPPESGFAKL